MNEEQNPQLVIFAGVNGAGKTSFYYRAQNILPFLQTIPYVNPDIIQRDKFPYNPLLAGKEAVGLRNLYLDNKRSFAFETTLSGISECAFIKRAKNVGYKINLIYIGLNSPEMYVERIANRVSLGGHNIKKSDVYRRMTRSFENFKKVCQVADRMYLFDNSGRSFRVIAINKNKANVFISKEIPSWANDWLD